MDPNILTLALWREASRHVDIAEFGTQAAALLRRTLPLTGFALKTLDPEHRQVITPAADGNFQSARAPCSPTELRRLQRWAQQQRVQSARQLRRTDAPLLRALGIAASGDDLLIGGIASEGGRCALLLLQSSSRSVFTAAQRALVHDLLEPFAAALDNHHRLHELNASREAAEADRQRLLLRFGRENDAEPMVGADGGLKDVMERVTRVRTSDVPTLILGETGAGKEVVAREIHVGSGRAKGPFIRVNCGAIPPELIDSELFGHEQGAFTGATHLRKGWFERADEGTLFLDEISDLPLAAQVRLLRVLQDGLIQRVGGEQTVSVNVRIVAATHRDLPVMVQEGRFRADLWYRLATFPILLPPLRERRQDIPELVEQFVRRAAARFGLRPQAPTAADLALLSRYHWPGNIRELQAVIDRATILGDGKRLEIDTSLGLDALPDYRAAADAPAPPAWMVESTSTRAARVEHGVAKGFPTLDAAMRQHIERALALAHGRIEGVRGAAAMLEINPHTLRARMRKLGVSWENFR